MTLLANAENGSEFKPPLPQLLLLEARSFFEILSKKSVSTQIDKKKTQKDF
jgi:hypothetical protein